MSGLFDGLRVGLRSLSNAESAMSVVNENIGNANTPGYSRKRILFKEGMPEITPLGVLGGPAEIDRIESARNRFLERRILTELQEKGSFEGQNFGLQQIEEILYSSGDSGISTSLSRFFNSFLDLASDPSSLALRQSVIMQGQGLASAIQDADSKLTMLRVDNRTQISGSIEKVNSILSQIAALNLELGPLLKQGLDGGVLADRRQLLMNQLAEEFGLTSYENEEGLQNIATSSGRLLLSGDQLFDLTVEEGPASVTIRLQGQDITSEIKAGKLAGYLGLENTAIPDHLDSLDTLARELAEGVNLIHRQGSDLDGAAGGDVFTYSTGDPAGSIAVALTDPRLVAAAASGSGPGDGSIAQQVADLRDQDQANLGGATFAEFYSQLVTRAGFAALDTRESLSSQTKIVTQLQNQRDSVSGVSLDEEAVNLLQFQRAYQASARMIRVIDQLLEETLNLVR